jgi:murein L,D-transpeptidase YcbB/YkuD
MSKQYTQTYIRRFKVLIKLFSVLVLQYFIFVNAAYSNSDSINQIMQSRMVEIQDGRPLSIDGNKIAATKLIPEFYASRNYSLAWQDRKKRKEIIQIIQKIDNEGLNPEDYFLQSLLSYQGREKKLSDSDRVDYDLLLTESLIRMAYHIRFGKMDPNHMDADWNLNRSLDNDPVKLIQTVIDSDSIQSFIDQAIPRQPFYKRYRKALAKYRKIKEQGGWQTVPAGPTLKPGMDDPRISLLKQRLKVTGDLSGNISEPVNNFDSSLEEAVEKFQTRHGLNPDGVVGKNTLQVMNVSVDDRIDQIRVNLERGRWLFKDIQGDFIIVNIAGYHAYLVRDNEIVWDTKVMVGKTYRKTPVFRSEMKYLVFNPTWTIPPGIMRKDILPKLAKNPDYVLQKGFDVLDREGRPIDPNSLDWSSYSTKKFPYTLRQPPGPKNALGRVKFIFPNSHFVYLHDTSHRELFAHHERAFSSGCIRVENPMELAELLLEDQGGWDQQRISKIIETNKTQTVNLSKPLTVLLLYWTIIVDDDGQVNFRKDVYDRDKKILDTLDGKFEFNLPKGLPETYYN